MSLEFVEWRVTDRLKDAENIFYYLEAELEEAEPPYAARAIGNVMEVRGGAERLAQETGVPAAVLEACRLNEAGVDRETMTRVMEAFRPESEKVVGKVA